MAWSGGGSARAGRSHRTVLRPLFTHGQTRDGEQHNRSLAVSGGSCRACGEAREADMTMPAVCRHCGELIKRLTDDWWHVPGVYRMCAMLPPNVAEPLANQASL